MKLQFLPIEHLPEIRPGDNLGQFIAAALRTSGVLLDVHDIIAVTQKAVSKAEGRIIDLSKVEPSLHSTVIARRTGKDARLIEVILRETRRIVRMRGEVLICETEHGFICANAGVDQSNVEGREMVTLLPKDPDRSARQLARSLGRDPCERHQQASRGLAGRRAGHTCGTTQQQLDHTVRLVAQG